MRQFEGLRNKTVASESYVMKSSWLNVGRCLVADLEAGRAGSAPPPSGDGLMQSLTVMF